MVITRTRRSVFFSLITLAVFIAAIGILYFFIYQFPDMVDKNGFVVTELSVDFAKAVYPGLSDLGKFFLTILLGVFVASITFSEKIVNFSTSSWWAKSLLILCWILLLISIVCDGVGIMFLSVWYASEMYEHLSSNAESFSYAFVAFAIAGITFGLALTSMLAAGIISFVSQMGFLASENGAPAVTNGNLSRWPPFRYRYRTTTAQKTGDRR